MKRFELKSGDLIMSCSGTMGKVSIVPRNIKKGIINQALLKLSPSSIVYNIYLKLWMQSISFQDSLKYFSQGAAIQNVASVSVLKSIEIPLPPLPEQLAIVAKIEELLSDLENGKQQLQTAQQQLKVYRQSLLKAAFDGKLTDKNVKEGELPEGWKWVKLKELINKIRSGSGSVPSIEVSDYPILRSSSVRNGKIDFDDVKYIQDERKLKKDDFIQKGDLLFTRLNGSVEYVGNCAKVPIFFPNNLIYPDRLFRLQLFCPEYADYIMYFFSTNMARKQIMVLYKRVWVEYQKAIF